MITPQKAVKVFLGLLLALAPASAVATIFNTGAFWKKMNLAAPGGPPGTPGAWTALPGTDRPNSFSGLYLSPYNISSPVVWTGSDFVTGGSATIFPVSAANDVQYFNPISGLWTPGADSTGIITPIAYSRSVWTGSKLITWGLDTSDNSAALSIYDSATNTWTSGAGYSSSTYVPGVWAGTRLVTWGGVNLLGSVVTSAFGYRYDPSGNSWSAVSTSSAPTARAGHSLVWTGSNVVVWGGTLSGGAYTNTGKRYNPGSDAWGTATSTGTNVPSARALHSAFFSGSKMYIWGGETASSTYTNTGAILDVGTDTWTTISATGAPSARAEATIVLAGSKLVVFGGYDGTGALSNGGVYDTGTGTWTAMPAAPFTITPDMSGYSYPCASAWSGSRVLISCGGLAYYGLYDPATNTWGAPASQASWMFYTLAWSGTKLYRWGGSMVTTLLSSMPTTKMESYDFGTGTWTALADSAPTLASRMGASAFWSGSKIIFWGGFDSADNSVPFNDGALYDPAANSWTAMSMTNAPSARTDQSMIWTGSKMVVWGGYDPNLGTNVQDGGRYDPATNTWQTITTSGAPTARRYHSAAWVNSKMIIWGGSDSGGEVDTGKMYDPATDTWSAFSAASPPSARAFHSAVTVGSKMIVWGGHDTGGLPLNTGKVWDSATGLWTAMSTTNAPTARYQHFAVSTGTKMIVWSGHDGTGSTYFTDGGVYDPATNTWTPMSTVGAPTAEMGYSWAWVGTQLVIWGGYDMSFTLFGSGAMYAPP